MPRRIPFVLFYSLLVLSISACSLGSSDSKIQRAAAPPTAADKIKALEAIAAMPTPMETFRALAPPEGLRFTPLFIEPLKDEGSRIKRLEDSVQIMRNDIDTLVPTLIRMVAIEKDIKGLVAQLQTLTEPEAAEKAPVSDVTPQELPPALSGGQETPSAISSGQEIPGEDDVKGIQPAGTDKARTGADTLSSLVTPEAASEGELPPEGAASPSSTAPVALTPQASIPKTSPQVMPLASAPPAPAAQKPTQEKPASNAPVMLMPQASAPEETPPSSIPEAPLVEPPAEKPEIKAEAEKPAGPVLGDAKGMRFSDYPDKTRVVIDMSVDGGAMAKLINDGKTLVVDLSRMKWLGEKAWDAEVAELVSGYHMEGSLLYIDLMYVSEIKMQSVLPPNGEKKDYRLVIDLYSPEVHQ